MMVEAMVVVAIGSRWIGVDAQVLCAPNNATICTTGAFTGQHSRDSSSGCNMCSTIKHCLAHDATGASCGTVTIGGVTYAIPPISSWDVSNVVNFKGVFADSEYATDESGFGNIPYRTNQFNANLGGWTINTASSVTMWDMFRGASSFTGAGIGAWNVTKVTDCEGMFDNARSFNEDISSWNTYAINWFTDMFKNAVNFDQDITGWPHGGTNNVNNMFGGATKWLEKYRRNDWTTLKAGPASVWTGPSPFTSKTALKTAVDNCLAASPSGACNCKLQSVDCGSGEGAPISLWRVEQLTDLSEVFRGKTSFNADISAWNTALVTRMNFMFQEAAAFNQDISSWNTNNVQKMRYMFYRASAFNQNIGSWNTESVLDMQAIFEEATAFNQNIGAWNTRRVTNLESAFNGARSFNSDITAWNTEKVTNMRNMLQGATAFNQNIQSWNTARVTNMNSMFKQATSFNQDITKWNTGEVTDMEYMFESATSFNQPLNTWDTSKVTGMHAMFQGTNAPLLNLASWNTGEVRSTAYMFQGTSFNGLIGGWDVSNVEDFEYMFEGNPSFNQDISSWVVTSAVSMTRMFQGATAFLQDGIRNWSVPAGAGVTNMFSSATAWLTMYRQPDFSASRDGPPSVWVSPGPFTSLSQLKAAVSSCLAASSSGACNCDSAPVDCGPAVYDDITQWNTALITDMSELFKDAQSFNADISAWNTAAVTKMVDMFSGASQFNKAIGSWNTESVLEMQAIFEEATAFNQNIGAWNTQRVTNLESAFNGARSFNSDITAWNTEKVTNMRNMLQGATAFNQNIQSWNTARVTNMNSMFKQATSFNQDITKWNTGEVTDMEYMFESATSFNQPLNTWDTSKVTGMHAMFQGTNAPLLNLASWNTGEVRSTAYMFQGTSFNGLIGGWDVSNVEDFEYMFEGNPSFNQDISSWVVTSAVSMTRMFQGATAFLQDGIRNWSVPAGAGVTNMFSSATAWLTMYRQPDFSASRDGPPSVWVSPGPFTSLSQLKAAVSSCLAASSSGACNCDSAPVDCGPAVYDDITQWNTALITDMSELFKDAQSFNADISAWNTAAVTKMVGMFAGASRFNKAIGSWSTALVTDMSQMFYKANFFTQNVGTWNMVNVGNISSMFEMASDFPGAGIGAWNTRNVVDMAGTFKLALKFNEDISGWNTASVLDMSSMFESAFDFNRPGLGSAGGWVTSSVTDMSSMFSSAKAFAPSDLSGFDVVNVKNMQKMFASANLFNGALSTWNTRAVTNMAGMFSGASTFNQPISSWNTASVGSFEAMFSQASSFSQPIGSWNTGAATSMKEMFYNATAFTSSIDDWDTSNVVDMTDMFAFASTFNSVLASWSTTNLQRMRGMFRGATTFTSDLTSWNTNTVQDMSEVFANATAFAGDIGVWNTSSVTTMANMLQGAALFNSAIGAWDTSSVVNMSYMMADNAAFNQPLYSWDTSNVVDMQYMLYRATTFDQDINNWDTSSVTSMASMFEGAVAFNGAGTANSGVGRWNTAAVTSMKRMFASASALNPIIDSGDRFWGAWNTLAVKDMEEMFLGASLFNGGVGNWNTGSVTSMARMFNLATNFKNNNVSSLAWDTSSVVDMNSMFQGASLMDLSINSWNVRQVTDMRNMFAQVTPFKSDITVWNSTVSYENSTGMFADVEHWPLMFKRFDELPNTDGPPNAYIQDCTNNEGVYASIDDFCVPQGECPFPIRCVEGNAGCREGSTGLLCRACLEGYYKSGTQCLECPENSAASAGVAAFFVVVAGLVGFKAAEALGAVSTNMIKKVVETLQFFSISFSVEIKWPLPVLNFADWLKAFNFNIEFLAPECAGANIKWPTLFWSGALIIPCGLAVVFYLRDRYAAYCYEHTVLAIRSAHDGEKTMFWIARPGIFSSKERRTYASESGDRVVKELQRQYKLRATLRVFGSLCLTILYLPIVRLCLQAFDCIKYGSSEARVLVYDVDVDCDSPEHILATSAACGIILAIGVGLPLFVINKVRRIRIDGKLDDARTLDSWGALYDIYRRTELTESDKLEISEIVRNVSRQATIRTPVLSRSTTLAQDGDSHSPTPSGAERKPTLQRTSTLARVEIDKSLSQSVSLRKPTFERTSTFKLDSETEELAAIVDDELFEEQSGQATEKPSFFGRILEKAKSLKNQKSRRERLPELSMKKKPLKRTLTQKARERASKMAWLDRLALNYLAIEMIQKLGVILAGSPNIAEGISIYGLVAVHWISALFVLICQPWRIITLGFAQKKIHNALNKTESTAGFLQGLIPLLGMIFATDSSLTGLSTAFLMGIICALLMVRVGMIVSERLSVSKKVTKKLNFEKEPEESANSVHREFIDLAKAGKIVSIYALRAQVAVSKRKVRARLEATREAMLRRVQHMKDKGDEDPAQIRALLEIANEVAHIVNVCTIQPVPADRDVEQQIESAANLLTTLIEAAEVEFVRRTNANESTAGALHLLLRIHAFDRAAKQLDDDMLEYARGERVTELISLGQEAVALEDEQRTLPEHFGTDELNASILCTQADTFTIQLAQVVSVDDVGRVLVVLNAFDDIIVKHETWRDACIELFRHPESESLVGDNVEANRLLLDETIDALKNHDTYLQNCVVLRAVEWKPLFKNFGDVKFMQVLETMTERIIKSIRSDEEDTSLEQHLQSEVTDFVDWCVRASQSIAECGFSVRCQECAQAAHDNLKILAEKKSKTLEKRAQKQAKKRTKKPGFFGGLFGGGNRQEIDTSLVEAVDVVDVDVQAPVIEAPVIEAPDEGVDVQVDVAPSDTSDVA